MSNTNKGIPSTTGSSLITMALTGLCVAGIATAHIFACYQEAQTTPQRNQEAVVSTTPASDSARLDGQPELAATTAMVAAQLP